MAEKPQEQTTKDRIIGLLRKGYTRSQLITDFNFAERASIVRSGNTRNWRAMTLESQRGVVTLG